MTKPSTRTRSRPQPLALPNTKISATILDFGQPLLAPYEDQYVPIEVVRATLKVVLTVWNAHVMAMPIWGKPELLAGLMDIVYSGSAPYQLMDAFEQLTLRRHEKFADDPRAVAVWDVLTNSDGAYNFRCDGRVPPGYAPTP